MSYADDLWTLKYLGRHFKWHHLSQEIAYQKRVRDKKLRTRIVQAKREAEFFLNSVDKAHVLEHINNRKKTSTQTTEEPSNTITTSSTNTNTTTNSHPIKRTFKQKLPTTKPIEDEELDENFLKSVRRRSITSSS
jgi:ESF2/ABP1 family protein